MAHLLEQWVRHELNLPCFPRYLEPRDRILVALAVLEFAPRRVALLRYLFKSIPGAWLAEELLTAVDGYACRSAELWLRDAANWSRVMPIAQPAVWLDGATRADHMRSIELAVKRNDLATTQRLATQAPHNRYHLERLLMVSLARGCLEIAQWLVGQDERSEILIPYPNDLGLELLLWIAHRQFDGSSNTFFHFATRQMHVGYCLRGSTQIGQLVLDVVAGTGDLALLKALTAHYIKLPSSKKLWFSDTALNNAARSGHEHMLEYMLASTSQVADVRPESERGRRVKKRKPDSIIIERLINAAARKGHLHIVKWLIQHWVPKPTRLETINPSLWLAVLARGHVELFRYLVEFMGRFFSGVHLRDQYKSALFDAAMTTNRLDIATEFGAQYDNNWRLDNLHHAATNGHLEVVQYLYDNTITVPRDLDPHLLQLIADNGHFHVVAWLLANRPNIRFRLDNDGKLHNREPIHGTLRSEPPCCDRPWWALRYIKLCLAVRPEMCSQCEWLPHWAIHCGEAGLLDSLESIHHPQLFSGASIRDASNSISTINPATIKSWFRKRRRRWDPSERSEG